MKQRLGAVSIIKVAIVCLVMHVCHGIPLCYDEADGTVLKFPTGLEGPMAEVRFAHRFYGSIDDDPEDNFLGLFTGTNVLAGVRFIVLDKLDLTADYIWNNREYLLGTGYTFNVSQVPLSFYAGASLDSYNAGNREYGPFLTGSASFGFAEARIIPAANILYDGIDEIPALGLGLNASILEPLAFIGEYYIPLKDIDSPLSNHNSFILGLIIRTYGHHFHLTVSNSQAHSPRAVMKGSPSNDLHFGFIIKRLISIGE